MYSRQRLPSNTPANGAWRRLACALVLGIGVALAAGCATKITFGSQPKTERLQSLKIGASPANDVMAALGKPRGHGQAKFDAEFPDTDIWFYEYLESDGASTKLNMLLVFMYKDVYMGHMWFASKQLVGRTE